MSISDEDLRRALAVLRAETDNFATLAKIAGLDKARDFRGADLRRLDFGTDDISGFDFSGANLEGADLSRVSGYEKAVFTDAILSGAKLPRGYSGMIDPKILQIVQRYLVAEPNSRASKALRAMLDKGFVTTADLNALGYDHPPRAIGDVRDAGIPIVTERIKTASGKLMARYRFGDARDIREDRHGGRSVLPKAFKADLLARYGSADCITGAKLDPRVLQIDHRVPYRVAGDAGLADRDASAYMLLDASSQRAKSWSCEQCSNFRELRDPTICKSCFWAYPEDYWHIAMQQIRRTDIVWTGDDVPLHDRLKAEADRTGISMSELLLRLARRSG